MLINAVAPVALGKEGVSAQVKGGIARTTGSPKRGKRIS